MNEDFEIKEYPEISIVAIIISSFAAIISAFILFIIFKSKAFQTYSFYYIIIFNITFILDNIFRIAPFDDKNTNNFNIFEKIQAYSLVFFNKFEICVITMQNLTFYLGVTTDQYSANQRLTFFLTLVISLFISFVITSIFLVIQVPLKAYSVYCYIKVSKESQIIDCIFHGIFYFASVFFLVNILRYLKKKIKEVKERLIEDLGYNHHLCKVLVLHFLTIAFFLLSFLSNTLNLEYDDKKIYDLLFLIIGFIMDLAYCVNRVLVKETLKIFCKDTHKQKMETLQKLKIFGADENYEDEEEIKKQRTESF